MELQVLHGIHEHNEWYKKDFKLSLCILDIVYNKCIEIRIFTQRWILYSDVSCCNTTVYKYCHIFVLSCNDYQLMSLWCYYYYYRCHTMSLWCFYDVIKVLMYILQSYLWLWRHNYCHNTTNVIILHCWCFSCFIFYGIKLFYWPANSQSEAGNNCLVNIQAYCLVGVEFHRGNIFCLTKINKKRKQMLS